MHEAGLVWVVGEALAAETVDHFVVLVLAAALHKVPAGEDVVLDVPGCSVSEASFEALHAGVEVAYSLHVVPDLDLGALAPQVRREELLDVPHALRARVDQDLHAAPPLW